MARSKRKVSSVLFPGDVSITKFKSIQLSSSDVKRRKAQSFLFKAKRNVNKALRQEKLVKIENFVN